MENIFRSILQKHKRQYLCRLVNSTRHKKYETTRLPLFFVLKIDIIVEL